MAKKTGPKPPTKTEILNGHAVQDFGFCWWLRACFLRHETILRLVSKSGLSVYWVSVMAIPNVWNEGPSGRCLVKPNSCLGSAMFVPAEIRSIQQ